MGNCLKSVSRVEPDSGRKAQPIQNGPRQSLSGGGSSKAKKSSLTNSRVEATDDSDQEGNKPSPGPIHYIKRRGHTNGVPPIEEVMMAQEVEEDVTERWPFPPSLDQFNLMDSDADPSDIEKLLEDERLSQLIIRLAPGQGLGLAIVGGRGSSSGDVPIYVKRILPESILQNESKIKSGDELVAVNDLILHSCTKEYATEALSNVQGTVRLLLIQDL